MQSRSKTWSDKYLTVQTVAGMLSFVFGAGLLYGEFKMMKIKNNELEKEFTTQIELQERRSDNRFSRASEWNTERREQYKELEKRLRELEIEISSLKAKQ